MNQLGLLQLSCAAVQVATHPSRKNWEKLLSVEKVPHTLLVMHTDAYSTVCYCMCSSCCLQWSLLVWICLSGGGSLSEGWCSGECHWAGGASHPGASLSSGKVLSTQYVHVLFES